MASSIQGLKFAVLFPPEEALSSMDMDAPPVGHVPSVLSWKRGRKPSSQLALTFQEHHWALLSYFVIRTETDDSRASLAAASTNLACQVHTAGRKGHKNSTQGQPSVVPPGSASQRPLT